MCPSSLKSSLRLSPTGFADNTVGANFAFGAGAAWRRDLPCAFRSVWHHRRRSQQTASHHLVFIFSNTVSNEKGVAKGVRMLPRLRSGSQKVATGPEMTQKQLFVGLFIPPRHTQPAISTTGGKNLVNGDRRIAACGGLHGCGCRQGVGRRAPTQNSGDSDLTQSRHTHARHPLRSSSCRVSVHLPSYTSALLPPVSGRQTHKRTHTPL